MAKKDNGKKNNFLSGYVAPSVEKKKVESKPKQSASSNAQNQQRTTNRTQTRASDPVTSRIQNDSQKVAQRKVQTGPNNPNKQKAQQQMRDQKSGIAGPKDAIQTRVGKLTEGAVNQQLGGLATTWGRDTNDANEFKKYLDQGVTDGKWSQEDADKNWNSYINSNKKAKKDLDWKDSKGHEMFQALEAKGQEKNAKGDKQIEEGKKGLGKGGQLAADAYTSALGMLGDMATGPAWALSMASRTYGNTINSTRELVDKGIITEREAEMNALGQAAKETGTEYVFKGAGLAKGLKGVGEATKGFEKALGGAIDKLTSKIDNKMLREIAHSAMKNAGGIAEEATEELLGGIIEPGVTNLAYANKVDKRNQNAYRENLIMGSTDLQRQVDYLTAQGYDRNAIINGYAGQIANDDYKAEIAAMYMENGFSEKQANKIASGMQEYMLASLSGDEKAIKAAEDKMVDRLGKYTSMRQHFSASDTLDAMASAALMVGVTGGAGSVQSSVIGADFRKAFEQKVGKANATSALLNTAMDLDDADVAARAQAMKDNGGQLANQQWYDLGQAIEKQTDSDRRSEMSARIVSAGQVKKSRYFAAPDMAIDAEGNIARDENGNIQYSNEVANYRASLVRGSVTQAAEQNPELVKSMDEDEQREVAESIEKIALGFADVSSVNNLTLTHPEARALFEQVTGETLPSTNKATREFLFNKSIENYVDTSRAATIDSVDVRKGSLDVQYSNSFGGEGQSVFSELSSNVDMEMPENFVQFASVAGTVYDFGRQGASMEDVLAYAESQDMSREDAQKLYDAGVADAEDSGFTVTYDVSEASIDKIKNSDRQVFLELAKLFGVNIVISDNLQTKDKRQANGSYVEKTNTLYLNLNDAITKNIGYTITHELTHRIKLYNKDAYEVLAKSFKERAIEKNGQEWFDEAIKERIERYTGADELDEDGALEEIIADQMGEILHDREFIENFVSENTEEAQTILSAIRDIIRKITQLFAVHGGFRSDYNEALLSELGLLREAEMFFANSIQEARSQQTQEMLEKEKYLQMIEGVDFAKLNLSPDGWLSDEDAAIKLLAGIKYNKAEFDEGSYVLGVIPEIYTELFNIGALDVVIRPEHTYENLNTKKQAEADGKYKKKSGKHYHNIPISEYVDDIESISDPVEIYDGWNVGGKKGRPRINLKLKSGKLATLEFYSGKDVIGSNNRKNHAVITLFDKNDPDGYFDGIADKMLYKKNSDTTEATRDQSPSSVKVSELEDRLSQFNEKLNTYKKNRGINYSIDASTMSLDAEYEQAVKSDDLEDVLGDDFDLNWLFDNPEWETDTSQGAEIKSREDLLNVSTNDLKRYMRKGSPELEQIGRLLYSEQEIEELTEEAADWDEDYSWLDVADIEERFNDFKDYDEPIIRRKIDRPEPYMHKNDGMQASYTQNRIDSIISEHSYGGNRASGYVTSIHPRDFLKLTLPDKSDWGNSFERWSSNVGGEVSGSEIRTLDEEELRNNPQTPYLRVDTENGIVIGHEGRHRMRAMLEAGITSVPIVIKSSYSDGVTDKGEKSIIDSMDISSQSFNDERHPVNDNYTTTISNVIPANEENRQLIEETYGRDSDMKFSLDSEGRELTPGQQEFFKNSQARDENGNLQVVYHTTNYGGFTVFDPKYSDDRRSLFFASDFDVSQTYGKYADEPIDLNSGESQKGYYAAYLNLVNPLIIDANGSNFSDISMRKELSKQEEKEFAKSIKKKVKEYAKEWDLEEEEIPSVYYISASSRDDFTPAADGSAAKLTRTVEILSYERDGNEWKPANYKYETSLDLERGEDEIEEAINVVINDSIDEIYEKYPYADALMEMTEIFVDNDGNFEWANKFATDRAYVDGIKLDDKDADKYTPYRKNNTRGWAAYAERNGYDGVIFRNLIDQAGIIKGVGFKPTDIFVAFNSNQVKSVDNENPTEDPDIRYSIDDNTRQALDDDGIAITESGSAVKYSLTSWLDTDQQKLLDNLMAAGFDKKSAKKWLNDVSSVAAIIAQDKTRLDYEADQDQKALKDNAEYYYTLDLSTLCQKRRLYQGTYNAIMHKLVNYALAPEDTIEIRALMDELGFEVPCGICYEESRKKNEGIFAKRWLNGHGKRWAGYKNMEHDDPYIPTLDEVTTTDGRAKLKEKHPEALESYLKYQRTRGSANPKVSFTHTDYRGDILNLTENDIAKVKHIGGLRIQSFSDLEMVHIIDMMQAVVDMASRNLTAQAYTKVPAFADIFGGTGIKINLSLIGRYNEETGQLEFDGKEGIDPDEAFRLRKKYSKHVGTILVGSDDVSILKAWADDRIDMVIPFHRSGWKVKEFSKLGLNNYKDYTRWQSERYDNGTPKGQALSRASKDLGVKLESIYAEDYWDYTKTGKENAEAYLKLCAEKKYIPVFSNFLVKNEDGSYSLQPDGSTDGYWKSLVDFKMYDNEGKGSPQEEVKPEFDMEVAQGYLAEYEGNADTLPVAQEVVDEFLERYKERHPGAKFSLDAEENKVGDVQLTWDMFMDSEDAEQNFEIAQEAISDLQEFERKNNGNSLIRTVGKAISTELVREGFVNFMGRKVSDARDVAEMCQVLRDPRFETSRIIMVKGDEVVSVTSVTSKLPGTSAIFKQGMNFHDGIADVADRMRRCGADGYYMVHNHPSGNVKASTADISSTAGFIEYLPGFKGHIILDHNKFGLIEYSPYSKKRTKASEVKMTGQQTIDFLHTPELDHELLGTEIRSATDVGELAKAVQMTDEVSVVVYTNTYLEVVGVQEIDNKAFNNKQMVGYFKNRLVDFGAYKLFVFTKNGDVYETARDLARYAICQDAIYQDENGFCKYGMLDGFKAKRNFESGVNTKDIRSYFREDTPSQDEIVKYSVSKSSDFTSFIEDCLEGDTSDEAQARRQKARDEIEAALAHIVRKDTQLTYGKTLNRKSVKKPIKELVFGLMESSENTYADKMDAYNYAMDMADAIWHKFYNKEADLSDLLLITSRELVEDIKFVDDDMYNAYNDLRRYMRNHRISVPEFIKEDISWADYRKKNFGRMLLTSESGFELDKMWHEISPMLVPFVDATEYTADGSDNLRNVEDMSSMFLAISDALDNTKAYRDAYADAFAQDIELQFAKDLAAITIKQGEAWESFADKKKEYYETRAKEMQARHKVAMRELREQRDKKLAEAEQKRKDDLAKQKQKYEEREEKRKAAETEKKEKQKAKKQDHKARMKAFGHIEKNYNWLTKRLLDPKKEDDQHIPEGFINSLASVLSAFDLQTERSKSLEERTGKVSKPTEALRKMREELQELSKEDESGIFVYNGALFSIMDKLIKSLDGHPLRDVNTEDLEYIDDMLASIKHMIQNENKLFADSKKEAAASAGESIIEDMGNKIARYKRRYDRKGVFGGLDYLLNESMMTPMNFFKALGGQMHQLYKNLRYGQDDYIRKIDELRGFFDELFGPYRRKGILGHANTGSDIYDWSTDKSVQTFKLASGEEIQLSVAQMMSLYCHSKREQSMKHILGSGVVVSDVKMTKLMDKVSGKVDVSASGYRMTYDDVVKITDALTDEQKEIAQKIQELMNGKLQEWGNETSMQLYGIRLFKEKNYFPIAVNNEDVPSQIGKASGVTGSKISNFGFTKDPDPKAANRLIIADIFEVVSDHANKMALYSAYAAPLTDFNRVLNYKQKVVQKDEQGNTVSVVDGFSVKGRIKDAYGSNAISFINNFLNDVNGQAEVRIDGVKSIVDKSLARVKKASIGANLRVLVQQPTAIVRAAYYINPKYFANPSEMNLKKNIQEMHEHCPIAAWKAWGNYQNDFTRGLQDIITNNGSQSTASAMWETATMGVYGMADDMTWGMIWGAVKNEVKAKHPTVKYGSEEFWILCNERASLVFDETQVVDSVFHRSDTMRSKDGYVKVFSSFMAEPTRTYNMMRSSLVMSYRLGKDGKYKEAAGEMTKALAVFAANAAAVSAAAALVDALRGKGGDDDDEYWELWYMNFMNNFTDNLKLWNNIVYAKDVLGMLEPGIRKWFGDEETYVFQPSNMVLNGWYKLATGLPDTKAFLTGEMSIADFISGDFVAGLGYITGVPAKTIGAWLSRQMDKFGVFATDEISAPIAIDADESSETIFTKLGIGSAKDNYQKHIDKLAKKYNGKSDENMLEMATDGYRKLVDSGDFSELSARREAIRKAGGDVDAFDEKIHSYVNTTFKKTIGKSTSQEDFDNQQAMKDWMLSNGWTEQQISDVVYRSDTARDFKAACRMLDHDAAVKALTPLLEAGLTEQDIYKLWNNRNRGNYDTSSTGTYVWGTEGTITSGFGNRGYVTAGASSYHQGIDIGAEMGTKVVAADGGVVTFAGNDGSGYGNYIIVTHDNGTQTYYGHLSGIGVKKGQRVSQSQPIGNVGSTGVSTGPHLHFAMKMNGSFVDPSKYIKQ